MCVHMRAMGEGEERKERVTMVFLLSGELRPRDVIGAEGMVGRNTGVKSSSEL